MRVTLGMTTNSIRTSLASSAEKLFRAQEIASTNKRITRPSDDVIGTGRSLSMRSALSSMDQFQRNTAIADTELSIASSAIDSLVSVVQELRDTAMSAAKMSLTPEARAAKAAELDGLMTRAEQIANTQNAGRYIFAGSMCDSPPMTWNADHSVHTYMGDDSPLSIRIGPGTTICVGVSAQDLFGVGGASDLFDTIYNLKQEVLAGNVGAISARLADIDDCLENVSAWNSQIGARLDQVETNLSALDDSKTNLTILLSEIEDADTTETLIELQTRENVYQAAIATANQILSLTLANLWNNG